MRESPDEAVLVHAARASHAPVRLPAGVVGEHLDPLLGADDLHAGTDGTVALPADGPAFGMWRIR